MESLVRLMRIDKLLHQLFMKMPVYLTEAYMLLKRKTNGELFLLPVQ